MNAPNATRVLRGACPHDCPDTCALRDHRAGRRGHQGAGQPGPPATPTACCAPRSRATPSAPTTPSALLQPLRRVGPKGSGHFEPVSWDEALDDIAARLTAIAARDPQAILPYSYAGTMGLVQGESMAARFFHQLGASLLDRTICSSAPAARRWLQTLGGKVGMKVEFFAESKLILIWGSNSIASNLHFWRLAQEAKRDGAQAGLHRPAPHRDGRQVPRAHRAAARHRRRAGAGADARADRERLARPRLHRAPHAGLGRRCASARCSGRPSAPPRSAACRREQIRALARDYGTTKPAAIRLNYGMQRVRGGGNAVRADRLPAGADRRLAAPRRRPAAVQLGPVPGRPRGAAAARPAGRPPAAHHQHEHHRRRPAARPRRRRSARASRRWSSTTATRSRWRPSRRKVVAGFAREDLFTVVLEHFQTDTADYADYVLPATTQLEHWDIHTSLRPHRRAAEPAGHRAAWARRGTNTQVFRELAARMGFDEPCFADDDETLCRTAFGDQVDFDAAAATQGFATLAVPDAPFAEGDFPTASGRCEFFSERLARAGPGRPARPPAQLRSRPAARARYPLAMISPPARNFLNSTFVNVNSLRDIEGEPLLEIHADDAARARHRQRRRWCACSTTAASTAARPRCRDRARARRGQRPGHLVAQARPRRHQRQRAHQPAPDRHRPRRRCSTTAWSKCRRRAGSAA